MNQNWMQIDISEENKPIKDLIKDKDIVFIDLASVDLWLHLNMKIQLDVGSLESQSYRDRGGEEQGKPQNN